MTEKQTMSKRVNTFANIVLVGAVIFFIAAFIYAIYRSNAYPSGAMNKYYLVFVVGITLFSFALKLRENYKINFVLTTVSMFIGIYLMEFFLFLYAFAVDTSKRDDLAQVSGVPFDTRTKLQAVMDLMKQGIDVYPSVHPSAFIESDGLETGRKRLFPLGGVSKKTTVYCNEGDEYIIFKSDEYGFNNPEGVFTGEDIDVILLGDSFTQGACVMPGEDIGGQLRRAVKRTINLGSSGNGPLTELATLKEYAEPLRPKVVLWLYYEGNDLYDLEHEKKSPLLLSYLNKNFSQDLIGRQLEIDQVLNIWIDKEREREIKRETKTSNVPLARIARLLHLRKKLELYFTSSPTPTPTTLFRGVLNKARDMTSSWGGNLYFVYLPGLRRYAEKVHHGNFNHRDQVLSIVRSLDVPVIDMHEVFITHPDPLSLYRRYALYRRYEHYTKEGYGLVAQTIETYLSDRH